MPPFVEMPVGHEEHFVPMLDCLAECRTQLYGWYVKARENIEQLALWQAEIP